MVVIRFLPTPRDVNGKELSAADFIEFDRHFRLPLLRMGRRARAPTPVRAAAHHTVRGACFRRRVRASSSNLVRTAAVSFGGSSPYHTLAGALAEWRALAA